MKRLRLVIPNYSSDLPVSQPAHQQPQGSFEFLYFQTKGVGGPLLLELNKKTATYLLSGLQRFYAHIIYFKERKITLAAGNFKLRGFQFQSQT